MSLVSVSQSSLGVDHVTGAWSVERAPIGGCHACRSPKQCAPCARDVGSAPDPTRPQVDQDRLLTSTGERAQ